MKSDAAPPRSRIMTYNVVEASRGTNHLRDSPGYERDWLFCRYRSTATARCFSASWARKTAKWAGKKLANSARWPKTSRLFSNELRRVVLLLFMHGISIRFLRNRHKCLIVIAKAGVSLLPRSDVTQCAVKS